MRFQILSFILTCICLIPREGLSAEVRITQSELDMSVEKTVDTNKPALTANEYELCGYAVGFKRAFLESYSAQIRWLTANTCASSADAGIHDFAENTNGLRMYMDELVGKVEELGVSSQLLARFQFGLANGIRDGFQSGIQSSLKAFDFGNKGASAARRKAIIDNWDSACRKQTKFAVFAMSERLNVSCKQALRILKSIKSNSE